MTDNIVLGCDKVIVVPQYEGTCWFNAVLMMLFYSEAARDVLLRARRSSWRELETSRRSSARLLAAIFSKMLDLYKRPSSDRAYRWFDKHPPEKILYLLHRYDPVHFDKEVKYSDGVFDAPDGGFGHHTYKYLHHVLRLLKVSNVQLDAEPTDRAKPYGPFRLAMGKIHSRRTVLSARQVAEKIASRPTMLLVALGNQSTTRWSNRPKHHYLSSHAYRGLPRVLLFGKATYVLDSVSLHNANKGEEYIDKKGNERKVGGHAIAGVTCNNTRFVYSGWMKRTKDKAKDSAAIDTDDRADRPCPLMPFDWAREEASFYVTSKVCEVQRQPPKPGAMKFNASWGPRTLVYVRKDLVRYKRHDLQRAVHAGRQGDRRRALGLAIGVGTQAVADVVRSRKRIA